MEGGPRSGYSRLLLGWNSYGTSELNIHLDLGNPTVGSVFQNITPSIVFAEPFHGISGLSHPRMDQGGVTKFFVLDQSGGQTTLVFGPAINEIPISHISMARSKPLGITVSRGEFEGFETVSECRDENEDVDTGNEMRENTEELSALLYSDDESEYSDDDEVTSTGHSPSTMTAHLDPGYNSFEKDSEDVASSLSPLCKKRKLVNDHHHGSLPLVGTSASESLIRNFDSDDAISSNGASKSISQNKAIKWSNIHETITVLQSLVPGVKGKSPVLILDESIVYLKSLKLKAAALGLGQL